MTSVRSPYFTRLRIGQTKPIVVAKSGGVKRSKNEKEKEKSNQIGIKLEYDETASTSTGVKTDIKPPKRKIKIETTRVKQELSEFEDNQIYKRPNWEPIHWKEQLENIRKMRSERDAPVDTMGCEKCKGEDYSEKDKRFHTLVSLMLSSQTKDHITHAAMLKLIDHGLSAQSIIKMTDEKLGELIYPVGFWKKKIIYLKKTAEILNKDYGDDIPDTVNDLVKLPGVGPKMAYLAMTCAWNKVVGIGVDVHVHRIANRLKWVRKSTTEPEKTRKELEDWLPQSYWREVNWLLVGFGQQICLPVSPRCSDCLNKNICPSSTAKSKKVKTLE